MHLFDVVPPHGFLVHFLQVGVQTALAKVFKDDVLAVVPVEVVLNVIGCAVLAIRETLVSHEFRVAGGAAPRHESRSDVDEALKLVSVLVKLLDEVEGASVA